MESRKRKRKRRKRSDSYHLTRLTPSYFTHGNDELRNKILWLNIAVARYLCVDFDHGWPEGKIDTEMRTKGYEL